MATSVSQPFQRPWIQSSQISCCLKKRIVVSTVPSLGMYLFTNSAVFLNIVLQASGFWLNPPPLDAFWSPSVCALVYKFCTYCAKILCTDACLAKVWVTVPVRKRNLLKLMSPQYPKYRVRVIPETSCLPEISGNTWNFRLPATWWFSKLNQVGSGTKNDAGYRVGFRYPLGTDCGVW